MNKLSVDELTVKVEKYLEKFNKTRSKWAFWKFYYFFRKLKKQDPTAKISAIPVS